MSVNNEIASQATPDDICDVALAHYDKLSKERNNWLSTIPHAIEVYRQYLKVAGKMPEEKDIHAIYQQPPFMGDEIRMTKTEWFSHLAEEYNQARQDCIMAFMKLLPKEKYRDECDKLETDFQRGFNSAIQEMRGRMK
jgi:hypothetical protein